MCDTGNTIRLAAHVMKEAGAKAVYAIVSHGKAHRRNIWSERLTLDSGLLSGDAIQMISKLPIERLVVY